MTGGGIEDLDESVAIVSGDREVAVKVSVFGPCRLAGPAGNEIDVTNRRARALLGMLALAPGAPLERDHISRLLWPGRFEPQARASLRQCLLELGRILDPVRPGILESDRQRVALRAGGVQTDLSELETALMAGRIDRACRLLSEIGARPLLDQIDLGSPFARWLADQRHHIEGRLQVAVERALAELKRAGTGESHAQLDAAWRACGRSSVATTRGNIRIAVLSFEQHVDVGRPLFLAEGVADELQARLGGIDGIAVIGRTSVTTIAQPGMTLPDIAGGLNADYLVEGVVRVQADQVNISLRLSEGRTGTEIWSDRYGGTVEDILAARKTLGGQVIAGICRAMRIEARPAPARAMTPSREAYALYLQGRALTLKAVGDGVIAKGIELLEQALGIDPDFAECWTALAEAHLYLCIFTPTLDRVERAVLMSNCARRAIDLDPAQGHARAMLALHAFINRRPCEALDLAFEAHRLAPDNIDVAVRLGSLLLYIGRAREALPYIEFAIERDPVHGRTYVALCAAHLCLGDYDKAIAAGQRMEDLDIPSFWLAVAQMAGGDREAAFDTYYGQRVHLGTTVQRPPGMPPMDEAARDAYFERAARAVCSGDEAARAGYCRMLDSLHGIMPDPYDPSIFFPAIWMGHAELVMAMYEGQLTLANMFGLMTLWVDADPVNRTWTHPEFLAFAERVGLVEAWNRYGWPDRLPKPEAV